MTPVTFRELPLDQVVESKWNPRKHFDAAKLEELAQSIREKGVLEPILVRPIAKNRFGDVGHHEIVAGARRYRAAAIAALTNIPAIIRELNDVDALELAVIENEQREDVNPMEQAEGYQQLLRAGKGYTPASLAKRLGKGESFVVRRLKLNGLEKELQTALAEGRLSLGHAEALLRLTPALRKEASHPENGVVWSRSPLLEYGEKWVPSADDLKPLSRLEEFIRTKMHFDPTARDQKHLQPGYRAQLELAVASEINNADGKPPADQSIVDEAEEEIAAGLIELTLDPMARSRMGLKGNAPAPLTPSKWKEVKSEKNRCEHTRRGVFTHGTDRYGEIINVCTKKSCAKHWPVAKKAKKAKPGKAQPAQESWEVRQRREEAESQKKLEFAKLVVAAAFPALAKHTAKTKFGLALVRMLLDAHDIEKVKKNFNVPLTESTAAQVWLLSSIGVNYQHWPGWLDSFRRECKELRFDVAAIETQVKKQQQQDTKDAKAKATKKAKVR